MQQNYKETWDGGILNICIAFDVIAIIFIHVVFVVAQKVSSCLKKKQMSGHLWELHLRQSKTSSPNVHSHFSVKDAASMFLAFQVNHANQRKIITVDVTVSHDHFRRLLSVVCDDSYRSWKSLCKYEVDLWDAEHKHPRISVSNLLTRDVTVCRFFYCFDICKPNTSLSTSK